MGAQTGRHVNVYRYRCACVWTLHKHVCWCVQVCRYVCICAGMCVSEHLHRHVCGLCALVYVHVCRHVCVCRCVCPFLWVRLTSFTSLVIGRDVSFLLTNIVLCSLVPELREPKTLQWAVLSGTLSASHTDSAESFYVCYILLQPL